jgi:hypothetical protein
MHMLTAIGLLLLLQLRQQIHKDCSDKLGGACVDLFS